jgi:hypothetical protein
MHEGDHSILDEEHDHDHRHQHEHGEASKKQQRTRIIAGVIVGAAVVLFLLMRFM